GASGRWRRRVQCHGGANERLERLFINLGALMEIDGTPGVAFETGVEEARRVRKRGALTKVIFTTSLYISPVQMIPACDHTGTPNIEFDGFLHFTSSTTSASACLMRLRIRASVSLRQSLSS